MEQPKQSSIAFSRRDVLRLGAAAAAGHFILPRDVRAAESFTWRRFAGQKIFVHFIKIPWAATIQQMLPEFEKQTGITVEFSELGEIQARQKLTIEFTGGSSGIDAFFTSLHVEKRRFAKSGWYLDLSKYLKDPTMTAPDYQWTDIMASVREAVTQPDGTISALPLGMSPNILAYRKDLFEQKGLQPPTTLAEMEEVARKLHNPPNMYGFVARGLKNANAPSWDWVLFSMGGYFMTKEGRASIVTPEAVKAMDYYAGMLRRFAPPGVVNFNWYECQSAFMQGQVTMYFDSTNSMTQIEDKEKSRVAGKVGYAVPPAGPGGRFSVGGTDGVAISSQSKVPGPAYFFAQWATSKQPAIRAHVAGVGSVRLSVWDSPLVEAEAKKLAPGWAKTYLESTKITRLQTPEIVAVSEYRDIIGLAIQKAIEGATSEAVLAEAQKDFQELLDKTER